MFLIRANDEAKIDEADPDLGPAIMLRMVIS